MEHVNQETPAVSLHMVSSSRSTEENWSGEGVSMITDMLQDGGFKIIEERLRELWNPDRESIERCKEFGSDFVKHLR